MNFIKHHTDLKIIMSLKENICVKTRKKPCFLILKGIRLLSICGYILEDLFFITWGKLIKEVKQYDAS